LANNKFACTNKPKPLDGAFVSDIIVDMLSLLLYDTQNCVGRLPQASRYFESLSGVTVCYVVWAIRVAILGWIGGVENRVRSDSCDGQYYLLLN
jgi:hypothetical protein